MTQPASPTMFVREDVDDVAVLRLSHGKVSALDTELCAALTRELDTVAASAARALIITGTGSAFSAGVDLFRFLGAGSDYADRFLPEMSRFFLRLVELPKPVVAAVNGHAIAGGCIIAAAADYRLMSRGGARIGVPELAVGVPFPAAPLAIVAARLSPAVRHSLIYTGRTVQADDAVAVGFADEAVDADHLIDRALIVARQLGRIPPATFALTKRALLAPILERVAGADDSAVIEAWKSEEVRAAVRAYLDRTVKAKRRSGQRRRKTRHRPHNSRRDTGACVRPSPPTRAWTT